MASAWEIEHREVQHADLEESHLRVERLASLRDDEAALRSIEASLRQEWGDFALLGFERIEDMAAEAGNTVFVVVERGREGETPRAIVQTLLADVHGDAEELARLYPSFADLISRESWARSREKGGDTAVLLQITTLGPSERGAGTGSLLRSAVLNILDRSIAHALTTTPVDGKASAEVDLADPTTYTPAMRFHARGGAEPALLLPGYKGAPGKGGAHGADIVVMRYSRNQAGHWPQPPNMKLHSMGPLQLRASLALRQLQRRTRRIKRFRPPSLPRRPRL
ncbi:MAG TPA: hypothetical protein VNN21_07920, partial [Dehalococcoidia bacterium]|nr:hypothetical protein [Dehalococcoidia bacterium]